MKRRLKKVLDEEAILGVNSKILTFDALGRPVLTRKQIEILKKRFRDAQERVEERDEQGGDKKVVDIGEYIGRRVSAVRESFDVHSYVWNHLRSIDAGLQRAADSVVVLRAESLSTTISHLSGYSWERHSCARASFLVRRF
jgi:hypothetical protein